jgi:hypothetical protein
VETNFFFHNILVSHRFCSRSFLSVHNRSHSQRKETKECENCE